MTEFYIQDYPRERSLGEFSLVRVGGLICLNVSGRDRRLIASAQQVNEGRRFQIYGIECLLVSEIRPHLTEDRLRGRMVRSGRRSLRWR